MIIPEGKIGVDSAVNTYYTQSGPNNDYDLDCCEATIQDTGEGEYANNIPYRYKKKATANCEGHEDVVVWSKSGDVALIKNPSCPLCQPVGR